MSIPLMKWLKSPAPIKPLYCVIGADSFFLSEIRQTFIKNIHLKAGLKDFNHDELSAKTTSIKDILALMETLPFLSERRLIFCNYAESFSDLDWKKLESFFSQAVQNTVLVCFFEKKDGRKKHFKWLKEKAVELSAESLRPWELEPWLDLLSQRESLNFASESKALFSQLVGHNLMEIQLELKKLKQYMGDRKNVLEKDILACTSRLKMDSIFDLTSAIGKRDLIKALQSLAYLLEQNQSEIGALAMLARHIRILSKIQEGKKQKLSKSQLAQKAGISPYFLKDYLEQSPNWSEQQIHHTMSALLEVDKALKSSPLSSHIWLENFILKTCS